MTSVSFTIHALFIGSLLFLPVRYQSLCSNACTDRPMILEEFTSYFLKRRGFSAALCGCPNLAYFMLVQSISNTENLVEKFHLQFR